MPTDTWDLAVVELVYYIPSIIPTVYLVWTYRQTAVVGWLFMFVFVMLQIIGSGMIVGAGQQGQPSNIAIILISVGLSPLLVGVAGILHGWAKATGYYRTKSSKRWASIIVVAYHIAVITAIGIYATGMSNKSKPDSHTSGQTMAEAGILLLLVLLLLQVGAFIILICTSASQPIRPLLFAIAISLLLLKIRLLYLVVAVFLDYEPRFNQVTGSIALRVIFQFLPGAFILLSLVTGGVMSARKQKEVYEAVRQDLPLELESQGSAK